MRLAAFALIALAVVFLVHKWMASLPDPIQAMTSLGLTIAAVTLWIVT
jgi:uncharacterized membrane protein YphA (DoxX/SURF4 family)